MKQMREFTIPFAGLKQGEHHFEFKIDTKFFTHFEYEEFHNVEVLAKVLLLKKSNSLEFYFEIDGIVNVNCDVTNEPYDQELQGMHHLVVNFGQEFNEDDDALIIIPHNSHEINIAQYIYELIVLSLPAKLVHPGIEDGTLDSDILKKLEELTPKYFEDKTSDANTDSRWEELKKLLTDK
ncbi:MAG: hypothetical protein COZ75_13730 [Flavobacteriaceae bacterium CG_4_8_14_3_um_filter_34_10]|nr:DUF177 domain-containing protein [Flavobacteriia bacterium]OIP50643.1 MAG: DNA-binding protein [Flavobacteriaceae bacterium CG2_30_34_30]PIQ17358.1 MAG: hypothetical protein COW66_12160 [Flavobacteriaceae bacterium CG18_big_fil_WC_8_21_14_2_50_34_36]PIX08117.1 MAG: hypothetical protein COZ75_13730 [Flavobacteriaceae bacterium CG_4_8_14_3_um_filter_34_10]PIZ06988.1 MAG: hypothetical protein COY56_11305 [Flavobacteriaceae bacterium CG_4_10_14_0_8_um_filter_34_31]PJC08059.1 MAG: hypothetical p